MAPGNPALERALLLCAIYMYGHASALTSAKPPNLLESNMVPASLEHRMASGDAGLKHKVLLRAIYGCRDLAALNQAILYYYANHENTVPSTASKHSVDEAQQLLRILSSEAINRDYIHHILYGTWGRSGSDMARILLAAPRNIE